MTLRVLCLLSASALLFAQGERGTFNGTVSDPSGAVIAGATVRAINVATNVETPVTTTSAGVYRMPYLPPGTYRLLASAPGFKTAIRENVILAVAQTLTVDFVLEVGQVTDQVTVSAEPPLLETGTAEIGSYVTKKEFDTWPIVVGDGRRQIQQFIFTSLPGTVGGTFQGSINGGQYYSHEILIEGISIGRMDLQGGSNNEFSPSAESVSEFKLQTGTVGAQYSGAQTAVANFATKSGTNEVHGSAYYYVQNDAFRANGFNNNASEIPRQPFKQHNFGYSIGGPVYLPKIYNGKNRTFFFHNLERTKQRNFVSTGFSTLPVPDFKRGDFSRLFNPAFTGNSRSGSMAGTDALGRSVQFGSIYDPATARQVDGRWVRDPFPGNIIPQNRWSPVSRNILEMAPITDPVFDTMLRNIPNIGTCCPHFDEWMLTTKADHQISANHRMSGLFNRNFRERNNSPDGRWGTPPGTPTGVYQLQNTPGTMARYAYDWTVRPTILNHFAIGYNRFGNLNQSVFIDQDWPQKIGMQNVPGTHFPTLTFQGQPFQGGGIGAGGRLGSANRGGSYNGSTIVQNDTSIIRGSHNIKVGMETRRYYYNLRNRHGSGDFVFNPATTAQLGFLNETGHSFASFLLGAASSASRAVTPVNFGYRWRNLGLYVMDDWKVNRKLTLNLGLRWEIIGGLVEVAGRMSGLDFAMANPGAGGRQGALVFVDDLGRRGFQNTYWRQISPKFGFAYAITDKLVMRGGYGINNMPPIMNGFTFPGTLGFSGSIAVNADNTPLRFAEEPVIYLHDRFPDFTATLPNRDPALSNGLGIQYQAPDSNRLGYTQNWNFGFQYQLPAFTVLEVNYIGNKGTRLEANGMGNLNALPATMLNMGNILGEQWSPATGIPQPFPGFRGSVVQALRAYPQFTSIGQLFENFGTSFYNSLQIQVTRHFRDGLSILGAYTFSKALALTDSSIDGITPADTFNRGLERAITTFHFPQVAKLTWIYELPIGPNKLLNVPGLAGKILGGWQVTGNHQFRSGAPISIATGGINNPVGAARADLVPGQPIIINSDAPINFRGFTGGTAYLNRNAFDNPPVHPGGRNVMTRLGTLGPRLPNVRNAHFVGEDLGIMKAFKFDEVRQIEIRGTFLNPFNRVGRGGLITNITDPNFGQFTGQQMGGRN
ncbi:MAG TPA: carboxypeptidase regulatory-like domain-containing protein, partial [Methylomirabilota bacterium]|nr:carboxypeptidase regulatory-like domain-containing protein [Methylomirabilota bacterium]